MNFHHSLDGLLIRGPFCKNVDELTICLSTSFEVMDNLYQIMFRLISPHKFNLISDEFSPQGEQLLKCFAVVPGWVFIIYDDINKTQIEDSGITSQWNVCAGFYFNKIPDGSNFFHLYLVLWVHYLLQVISYRMTSRKPPLPICISSHMHVYTHRYGHTWAHIYVCVSFLPATNLGGRNGQLQPPL